MSTFLTSETFTVTLMVGGEERKLSENLPEAENNNLIF